MQKPAIALLVSVLSVPALSLSAQHAPADRQGPIFGTFSSLKANAETGDVLGKEITILPQYKSARVIFQCAEGEPEEPVLVPATTTLNSVDFDIKLPSSPCNGHYHGTLTPTGLRLGGQYPETLPRKKSYWAP
jgi:hypothetical protein